MSAVAKQDPKGGVPALYTPPPMEIDASDVQIGGVKFGHPSSTLCQDHDIKLGTIYTATSKDDPDPQTLYVPGGKDEGVLLHVLGMYKGKSYGSGDDFETWGFNDPDAHPDADTTYNYQLALPEIDPDMPFKMTVSRSKAAAARTINTVLVKNAAKGPAYTFAFRMTTVNKRKEGVGSWTVPQVRLVEATPENVAIAEQLAMMVGSRNEAPAAPASDAPAI